MSCPGLILSAPASGCGKTTVALGLMRILKNTGYKVQPFKSGPDYIDPQFHHAACGRASCNLDSWAMEKATLIHLLQGDKNADLAIVEGAMGLFDGVIDKGAFGTGTTADIAVLTGWPVILIIDISRQAQSAAAIAKGFAMLNEKINLAGVILNRVASSRHERLARDAMMKAEIPVLGALPKQSAISLPERHLGLVLATENPDLDEQLETLAEFTQNHCNMEAILQAARPCASFPTPAYHVSVAPPAQHIALAQDAAFAFIYPHILNDWRSQGAQISLFSPLADEPPDPLAEFCWLPGGYPELYAGKLAHAHKFKSGLQTFAESKPVHGECGGYMVMGKTMTDKDGDTHEMLGLLGLATSFAERKLHLGYRLATLTRAHPAFPGAATLRGHEFHYATISQQPDMPLATIHDAYGNEVSETGSVRGNASGSFFHLIGQI